MACLFAYLFCKYKSDRRIKFKALILKLKILKSCICLSITRFRLNLSLIYLRTFSQKLVIILHSQKYAELFHLLYCRKYINLNLLPLFFSKKRVYSKYSVYMYIKNWNQCNLVSTVHLKGNKKTSTIPYNHTFTCV